MSGVLHQEKRPANPREFILQRIQYRDTLET